MRGWWQRLLSNNKFAVKSKVNKSLHADKFSVISCSGSDLNSLVSVFRSNESGSADLVLIWTRYFYTPDENRLLSETRQVLGWIVNCLMVQTGDWMMDFYGPVFLCLISARKTRKPENCAELLLGHSCRQEAAEQDFRNFSSFNPNNKRGYDNLRAAERPYHPHQSNKSFKWKELLTEYPRWWSRDIRLVTLGNVCYFTLKSMKINLLFIKVLNK